MQNYSDMVLIKNASGGFWFFRKSEEGVRIWVWKAGAKAIGHGFRGLWKAAFKLHGVGGHAACGIHPKNRQWQFFAFAKLLHLLHENLSYTPQKLPMAFVAAGNLCSNTPSCSPCWCMYTMYILTKWNRSVKKRKKKEGRKFWECFQH